MVSCGVEAGGEVVLGLQCGGRRLKLGWRRRGGSTGGQREHRDREGAQGPFWERGWQEAGVFLP